MGESSGAHRRRPRDGALPAETLPAPDAECRAQCVRTLEFLLKGEQYDNRTLQARANVAELARAGRADEAGAAALELLGHTSESDDRGEQDIVVLLDDLRLDSSRGSPSSAIVDAPSKRPVVCS